MIVYAWKQFWNDFNNGDEALFQDANRPRDNNRFKITPWLQSWRWDWKKTNTNRMPSLFHVYWYSLVTWYNPNDYKSDNWVNPTRIKFKSSYLESDFSSIAPYSAANTKTYTAKDLLWFVKDAYWENGDAKAAVRNEWLEILEDGVYFIDAFAQFVYPNWYSSDNIYPLFMSLLKYNDNTKLYDMYATCQGRSCFYLDRLHETYAAPLASWTRLSLAVAHWYTSAPILVACGITAVRMW